MQNFMKMAIPKAEFSKSYSKGQSLSLFGTITLSPFKEVQLF